MAELVQHRNHPVWAERIRRLCDQDDSKLLAAGAAVQEMIDSEGWKILAELIENRRSDVIEQMTGERVLQHVEYASKAHLVRAFDQVTSIGPIFGALADEVRQRREEEARAHAAQAAEEGTP